MTTVEGERLIVLATNNRGKVVEMAKLLDHLPIRLAMLSEVIGPSEIPEPFATFRENAAHKARIVARLTGEWALAEDSGLAVDALAGRPGVYSARFAGKGAPDQQRVARLLQMLADVPDERRTAHFHCAIALASRDGILGEWHGECEGHIVREPRGEGGFGFDPIFVAAGLARTNAELSPEEKNAISHRGTALRKMIADLPRLLRC